MGNTKTNTQAGIYATEPKVLDIVTYRENSSGH